MQDSNTLTDINKPVNGKDIKIDGNEKKQEKTTEHFKKERIPPDKIDYSIYCEGDKISSFGKIIDTLIINDTDYIVFLDEDHFVQWYCKNSFDKITPKDDVGKILNKVAMLETKSEMLLANFQLPAFRRLLGEAIARLIADKDVVNAESFLSEAETFLNQKSIERAKKWYIISSSTTSIFIFLIGLFGFSIYENFTFKIVNHDNYLFSVIYLSLYGALGAFFSIISRTKELQLDPSAGKFIHIIESILRIFTGVIGAFFVILAIKTKLIFSQLADSQDLWWILMIFAIISGFSERFVPNIIKQFEDMPVQVKAEKDNKSSTDNKNSKVDGKTNKTDDKTDKEDDKNKNQPK